MYAEDDLLPISGLQHLLYCPRQCALIHVERLWVENLFTAQGRVLHERAHSGDDDRRGETLVRRAVQLRSLKLGLAGEADVVEMRPDRTVSGGRRPYPVEYKRGRPKSMDGDRVQLCAQAMCLEEMLGLDVPEGALFYGKPRRRTLVSFEQKLRDATTQAARRFHDMVASGRTPPADPGDKCKACSLAELCLPALAQRKQSVRAYLARMVKETP
jgi:CRISPR-associated exonuclease Cas4